MTGPLPKGEVPGDGCNDFTPSRCGCGVTGRHWTKAQWRAHFESELQTLGALGLTFDFQEDDDEWLAADALIRA